MSSATVRNIASTMSLAEMEGVAPSSVLVMSTSLLTDRMLLYTQLLTTLSKSVQARVWASSNSERYQELWAASPAVVENFPDVRPFREFPYNMLRRLNEFTWDLRRPSPSRLSMWRHVRSKTADRKIRVLKLAAHALSTIRAEQRFEGCVEKLLLGYPRSEEARQRLLANRPAVLVTTGPFQFEQPAIVAEAKNLGIPVIALIPSWDNISTKNRMVFKYDGYIVWSQRMREELREYYPDTRGAPVYVVGAPQFDVFFRRRFSLSRRAFCTTQGLRADLPIIVFALGSP